MIAHGLRQIADYIALSMVVLFMRAREITLPQRETIVMLCRQHHVARVYLAEKRRHFVRLPSLERRVEAECKIIVVKIAAVILVVIFTCWTVFKLECVQIPLGIRIEAEPIAHIAAFEDLADVAAVWRPSRHRIKTPMNEDAQLGIVIPIGHLMRPYRFQRRFKFHSSFLQPTRNNSPF